MIDFFEIYDIINIEKENTCLVWGKYFFERGVCYLIQEIIDKFKEYMAIHNLHQGEAAELINISRTHLNKVLNGRETPSMALLMRMEKVMQDG